MYAIFSCWELEIIRPPSDVIFLSNLELDGTINRYMFLRVSRNMSRVSGVLAFLNGQA